LPFLHNVPVAAIKKQTASLNTFPPISKNWFSFAYWEGGENYNRQTGIFGKNKIAAK
jgi:hypothetical protein